MINTTAQRVFHRIEKGLAGGMPGGGTSEAELHHADGRIERFGIRADIPVTPGDVIVINGAGGGGNGCPLEREIESVQDDVDAGYVSAGAAVETYGVVFEADSLRIDHEATERERKSRRELPLNESQRDNNSDPEYKPERKVKNNV